MKFVRMRNLLLIPSFCILLVGCVPTTPEIPSGPPTSTALPTPTATPVPGPTSFEGRIIFWGQDETEIKQFSVNTKGAIEVSDYPLPIEGKIGECLELSPQKDRFLHGYRSYQIIDIESKEVTPLLTLESSGCGVWSPDGGKIAYMSLTGDFYVYDISSQQNILVYETPKAMYGVGGLPQANYHGDVVLHKKVWIGGNKLLFDAMKGGMPSQINLGGQNPGLRANTTFLATLTAEKVILDEMPMGWYAAGSCMDGKFVLLASEDGTYYSQGFDKLSEIKPEKLEVRTRLNIGVDFLPGSCDLFYPAIDQTAQWERDPVYLHILNLETMDETKWFSAGIPEVEQRHSYQFVEWVGDPAQGLVMKGNVSGWLYLYDLKTGGRTCLMGILNTSLDCLYKRDGFIENYLVLP